MINLLIFLIENVLFWGFVFIIVIMGCETPSIVFSGFGLFLFYWIFRFIFRQPDSEKLMWIYVINMIFCILLLYYFMTGVGLNKSIRSFFNSVSKQAPGLEPYLKRC
jgi:hypothetical protein